MSVTLLPKFQIEPGEDPDVTAARLHRKKNKPANAAEDMEFPPYQYFQFPTAMYREWDPDQRENEVYRVAGKYMLDLEKRRDRLEVDRLVGEYETINVGVTDFVRHSNFQVEVVSELREKNEREHAARLEEGWADKPTEVKAAKRRLQMKLAAQCAEREGEDAHLGEKAYAEMRAVDDAADDHVVNVPETRKQLQAEGKLPKEKK